MSSSGSVSTWIAQLQKGDEAALAKLHARYWPGLTALARKQLRGAPMRAADEEDVAQEAFWRFYRGLKAGRLPKIATRFDLLALLTHIVAHTAINQTQHERVQKRGGDRAGERLSLEWLVSGDRDSAGEPVQPDARTPLDEALLKDCYEHYLNELPEKFRGFAEHYLAGLTNLETAEQMRCSERTVERKIARILKIWQTMAAESVNREIGTT